MNSSDITCSLGLVRAPVINSETKEANRTKCTCFIGKQREIHNDHIVNILFQASISFKTNEKVLVDTSHKLIHVSPVQ